MVKGVDHITINVVDLDETRHFYKEILQLEELPSISMDDHDLYYFALGNGKLELIQYKYDTQLDRGDLFSQGKYRHLALQVNQIEELYRVLKENDVKILQEPKWNDTLQFTGMLVLDPNGCEIEFVDFTV